MFIVYVLICRDGSLYTGWTRDMEARLARHNRGKAARYTRSRLPCRLLAWWEAQSLSSALRQEAGFKRLTRAQKLAALAREETVHLAGDSNDSIDAVRVIIEILRKNRENIRAFPERIDDAHVVADSADFPALIGKGNAAR